MFREFVATMRAMWTVPRERALLLAVASILGVGTVFYRIVEGWSWLDAFYFSVITLTTVGYGDLHPTRPSSKIFTVFFIFVGVGLILAFLNYLVTRTIQRRSDERADGPH